MCEFPQLIAVLLTDIPHQFVSFVQEQSFVPSRIVDTHRCYGLYRHEFRAAFQALKNISKRFGWSELLSPCRRWWAFAVYSVLMDLHQCSFLTVNYGLRALYNYKGNEADGTYDSGSIIGSVYRAHPNKLYQFLLVCCDEKGLNKAFEDCLTQSFGEAFRDYVGSDLRSRYCRIGKEISAKTIVNKQSKKGLVKSCGPIKKQEPRTVGKQQFSMKHSAPKAHHRRSDRWMFH